MPARSRRGSGRQITPAQRAAERQWDAARSQATALGRTISSEAADALWTSVAHAIERARLDAEARLTGNR